MAYPRTKATHTLLLTGASGTITVTPSDNLGGRIQVIDSLTWQVSPGALAGAGQLTMQANNGTTTVLALIKVVMANDTEIMHLAWPSGLPFVQSDSTQFANLANKFLLTDSGGSADTAVICYHFVRNLGDN